MKRQLFIPEIEPRIQDIRGQKVLLDRDLARLYGTTTRVLNQAVKRNRERFPADFLFRLTREEVENLRSQNVTSRSWGGHRYRSFAFTEHGALMAARVLNTPRAVEVSLFVVRAFVKLREWALAHKEITKKLTELERKVGEHDGAIQGLVAAIRQLMSPPATTKPKRRIGFHTQEI